MGENEHTGSGRPFSCSQIDKAPETFSLLWGFAPHCGGFTENSSGVKKEDKISGARVEEGMAFL